jgi:hypothetical protein
MKPLLTIRLILLLGGLSVVVGCETEPIIFEGPYFVRFTETALTTKESFSKVIPIEVHSAGPYPKSDMTITYSISGTAREGIDYIINGPKGKVEIQSGEYVANINLELINNSNNILRSQDIVLTLLTVDHKGIQIGQGVSGIGNKFTLTIQDDCILGGTYYGIVNPTDIPITDITVSSTDCETYLLSNWNIDLFQFSDALDLRFIDNGDNTLTIPPQEQSDLPPEVATIDGFGVVDPSTRVLTFTVRLVDIEDDQNTATFKLIPD